MNKMGDYLLHVKSLGKVGGGRKFFMIREFREEECTAGLKMKKKSF